VFNWFRNFDGSPGMPARAFLTARNPVSNFVPNLFGPSNLANANRRPGDRWSPEASYTFGDWVTFDIPVSTAPGAPTVTRSFICLQPHHPLSPYPHYSSGPQLPITAGGVVNSAYWEMMPWVSHPTKTSVNTASFGQLWVAYCNVMSRFGFNDVPQMGNGTGIFGSLERSSPRFSFSPQKNFFLRGALAAVNTMDLRDSDDDVTSRTIVLTDYESVNPSQPAGREGPQYLVTVYGTERQPYITEIYARSNPADATNAYVAVELHNPYPTPIKLTNWRLARVSRPAVTGFWSSPLTLEEVLTPAGWTSDLPAAADPPVVPPHGCIVLASSRQLPRGLPGDPAHQPVRLDRIDTVTGKPILYVVPHLLDALDHELLLLRPHRATGDLRPPPPDLINPLNDYNEGTALHPNLEQMVPVDSYDFYQPDGDDRGI